MRTALVAALLAACSSSYPAPYDGGRSPEDAAPDAYECGCTVTQICCDAMDGLPGGVCANYMIDTRNCGTCGNVCAAGQSCIAGGCR